MARIAELTGITYTQIQKYEKGQNRISAGRLYDIAHHLNVPVSYFFEGLEAEPVLRQQEDLRVLFSCIEDAPLRKAVIALAREIVRREERARALRRPAHRSPERAVSERFRRPDHA